MCAARPVVRTEVFARIPDRFRATENVWQQPATVAPARKGAICGSLALRQGRLRIVSLSQRRHAGFIHCRLMRRRR